MRARGEFTFAIGGAPAEGGLPLRLFEPAEMRVELRGGGTSYRHHDDWDAGAMTRPTAGVEMSPGR